MHAHIRYCTCDLGGGSARDGHALLDDIKVNPYALPVRIFGSRGKVACVRPGAVKYGSEAAKKGQEGWGNVRQVSQGQGEMEHERAHKGGRAERGAGGLTSCSPPRRFPSQSWRRSISSCRTCNCDTSPRAKRVTHVAARRTRTLDW